MAPRKVRVVANLIKGLSANEAEAALLNQRRRPAVFLLKLLRSAIANAKSSKKLDPEKLFIKSIRVDGGPMLKRSLPRARGMATPIQKKMSHIAIVLEENASLPKPRFTIVVKKKTKKTEGKPAAKSKPKSQKDETVTPAKTGKKGFLKRMFNRKSIAT